jgi:hypothetical protein
MTYLGKRKFSAALPASSGNGCGDPVVAATPGIRSAVQTVDDECPPIASRIASEDHSATMTTWPQGTGGMRRTDGTPLSGRGSEARAAGSTLRRHRGVSTITI